MVSQSQTQTQGLVIVGGFEAFQAALQVLDSNIQTYIQLCETKKVRLFHVMVGLVGLCG